MNNQIKLTALNEEHKKLNAKLVSFAGYSMPINYPNGILSEYNSVRKETGLFDVSHMGKIFLYGKESLEFLEYVTVNNINIMKNGDAQYSAICNINGGIKDDIIIYKLSDKFILIVNASNCDKIFNWLIEKNNYKCTILNKSDEYSLIALQGPRSRFILKKLLNQNIDLMFYKHQKIKINSSNILISRTGYTGELGFEIFGNHEDIKTIWSELIKLGADPCGLAVRDILRLEMKYCLYGNDINEFTTPLEAGLGWIVELQKDKFIGKNSLLKQKQCGVEKKLISFHMIDKSIPRKGYKIYFDSKIIGEVTSGTYSLGLDEGIGIGYVKKNYDKVDTKIFINIREKMKEAEIIKPPFLKEYSLHD